jgi:hypothetical protein
MRDGAERAAERQRPDVAHEDSAGYELYQRKPRLAPTSAPQKIVSSPAGGTHEQQVAARTACRST